MNSRHTGPGAGGTRAGESPPGAAPALRVGVYAAFFLSGATALAFEILWSRQFVTVFGNSAYAISIVLCAFMAGLGVGSWLGGRLADRSADRLLMYAAIQVVVALWALAIPVLLACVRRWVPSIALLAPESLLLPGGARFLISFGILFVPCMLMGATLPLLSRFCTESREVIGRRVGLLYGLNTLGATAGCFVAGYWLIDSLGLSITNEVAVGVNLFIAAGIVAISIAQRRQEGPLGARPTAAGTSPAPGAEEEPAGRARGLLLAVAFVSGLAALSCEVLWVRYLAFLSNMAYTFTVILGIYLLGLGTGSMIYRFLLARLGRPLRILAATELLLGLTVLVCFALGAHVYSSSDPGWPRLLPMTAITVFAPTVLMGIAFPLICAAYTRSVATLGRSVGVVYAVNTAGTVIGSLAPVFVLVPWLGIQRSLILMAVLYWMAGTALLWASSRRRRSLWLAGAGAWTVLMVVVFAIVVPPDLCKRVFLSTSADLGRHNDIIFYREGRTGTAIVVRNKVTGLKRVYINGTSEVPTTYSAMSCFKFMGGLGPLLHPDPKEVLMICFGGGVAAGATVQYPEVESLEVVDLEGSIVEAARLLQEENNDLLSNPKVRVVIDDGRNYILASRNRWPVIVSDSTHPKSTDSWVLYTREFYRTAKEHLTEDGVFVQWVPMHRMSVTEYRIILRTFQSVFPHASVWFSDGIDETGRAAAYTLLAATPKRLTIDLATLRRRLSAPSVRTDLRPFGLDSPVGVLENFVCAEETLREWTGDGPINTDDLPYTQYETKYSRGEDCTVAALIGPMESVWPYLTNTGDEEQSQELERELALHAQANRLLFAGNTKRAFALLPEDAKLRKCRQNLALGRRYVQEVAEYYADSPTAMIRLAQLAASQPGNVAGAIALYRKALALAPDNALAHNGLGLALAAEGRSEESITHYRRALRISPRYAEAHSNLGIALFNQGRPDEAIAHYGQAIRHGRDFAQAHSNIAIALAAKGRLDEAITHYRQALRIDPHFAEARHNYGVALAAQGKADEAIAEFRNALRADPSLAAAHKSIGVLLDRQERLDEAAVHLSKALQLEPDYAAAHHRLGQVLFQQGKLEEAVAHFSEALRIDPRLTAARQDLALALHERSRREAGQ